MNAIFSDLDSDCSSDTEIRPPYNRTIVICEANPVLAYGIQQILQRNTYLSNFNIYVDTTPDLIRFKALAPDILIIDPWHSNEPWAAVSKIFLGLSKTTCLIGYCSEISSVEARMLSRVGFRGIMPKTVRTSEFVRIVCAVAFGGIYLHENYIKNVNESVVSPALSGATQPDLTEREIEVLRHVALGNSMKEIAAVLKISTKTVDTYKTRANLKLKLRSRSDIVRYAIQSGWMH